jgi:hypothetical protein
LDGIAAKVLEVEGVDLYPIRDKVALDIAPVFAILGEG